ncbi:MAG TPA: M48 family metallopeptidase, partial [Sphingomonas sp.]|nr:M48 family metallopeptidase [Sphingomonas sp.]
RDGKPSKATVAPEPGCTTEFLIGRGRGLRSASSDGARITVSAEIVEFAQSDDELALVMAHELSHNILGHNRGYAAQRIAGTDLSGARGRDHEREADRWALYLLARAGYDPGVAPGFWRRWGPRTDLGILGDGSHPDWRDRAQRAEAELERIRAQQAAGEVPIP